jgi:MFS family permease
VSVRGNLLSFGTAWGQGFLEGGLLAFLPGYLVGLGYAGAGAGSLMACLMLGVVTAQVTVTWLADRLGRARVLLATHGLALAVLVALPWCAGPVSVGGLLFVLGACGGAQYPVGLALLGEQVQAGALARANALYLAANCVGSVVGPVVVGPLVDRLGGEALFLTGAAVTVLVVGAWALGRNEPGGSS